MRHKWTDEDNQYIRNHYGKIPSHKLAEHFGVSKEALIQHCFKVGITTNRYYTKAEEEYIIEHFGTMTSKAIASNLGRTERALIDKIHHMGLGKYLDNSDALCLAEVSRLVHRDKETLKSIWTKYGLRIKKKGKYSMISQHNLAEVMKNNPQLYDATECDDYFRYYKWFNEKLIADRIKKYDRKGA